MRGICALVLLAACLPVCISKGELDPPHVIKDRAPDDMFATERLKSFRGGFDRGDVIPGRARRPNPDYDNFKYGGVNFFEHELIYLEGNLLMDWQPRTGEYRIFELVRHPEDLCPVLPERTVASGVWESRKFHKLLYIGCGGSAPGGKLLDYYPSEGTYEIFRFNHKVQGNADPVMESLAKGFRREIMNFNPMYMNEDEIFFYEKNTGSFSIYYLNPQLPSIIDPIQPPEPLVFGKLQGLHEQQIYLGKNTMLDYDPLFGRYWLYTYDRTSMNNSNPFIGPTASGVIEKGMTLTYVAENQVIMMNPETGMFGLFDINRPPVLDAFAEERKTDEQRENERVSIYNLQGPAFALKQEPGNFGFGSLVTPDHCVSEGTCRNCLKKPGCGWCATSSQCYRGSTVQPCSTNCTTWMPVFCEAEPCSSHFGCSSCLSDPFCGWCADDMTCTEGTYSGPLFGNCGGWSKSSCPLQSDGEGPAAVEPCVAEGLISL